MGGRCKIPDKILRINLIAVSSANSNSSLPLYFVFTSNANLLAAYVYQAKTDSICAPDMDGVCV